MNKKISLGIIAILMTASVVIFAQSNKNTSCPDKPGCICSKEANVTSHEKQIVLKKTNCPDTPGCICK